MYVAPASAQSELDGAWEVTAASNSSDGTIENVQPSLFLFQDGYYSVLMVWGNEPRRLYEEGEDRDNISLERLQEIVSPVTGNSGRFEIDGSTVIMRPTVAISPNFMTGGSLSYEFNVEGDELTFRNDEFDISLTLRRLN